MSVIRGDTLQTRFSAFELAFAIACAIGWVGLCIWVGNSLSPVALTHAKDSAQFLAVALGVPAVVIGLFNQARNVSANSRAELWQRRRFVLEQVTQFEAMSSVKLVMKLLDYTARRVIVPGQDEPVRISDKELLAALAPLGPRTGYSSVEVALRDAFDEFFGGLDRLGVMREAGLIELGDLTPYIGYWLELLDGQARGRDAAFGPIIRTYIASFYFDGLESLMKDVDVQVFSKKDEKVANHFAENLANANAGMKAPVRTSSKRRS